ncbi:succinate semialdehyde dehydrogenase, putative [Talaromyces stipitatus ATCC 10500]|uniref:Succinate semialdehyde dehydrogenase, putative n=1 Tax=Talaromyces stipitatus (strain ATCC 10500 / CBS 375.48 / QM 6759 / NRRL 1006) TaxID=441959 RepID=B8M191_TALSN|nr:succinate semialdehyde dehydrogenase, putative [Talaromyces stipitatus ATCC 10500]EED21033.1 succinate semialdehyde dehydrogenase, putative [Talaromyces stipitatus ATCC 10500]
MKSTSLLQKNIPYTFHDPTLLDNRPYVGGTWNNHNERKTFEVEDCNASDYSAAIEIAHKTFPSYKTLSPKIRGKLLRNWSRQVSESAQDLAAICTLELGKPFKESLRAVDYAVTFLDWFANLAEQGCGMSPFQALLLLKDGRLESGPFVNQSVSSALLHPNNSGVLKKIAPALAVGCTVVHKPAPETPLCAITLAKTCERAGFPAGAYNMLPSSPKNASSIGSLFSSHSLVRHVTFTGSISVGKFLAEKCGANLKKMTIQFRPETARGDSKECTPRKSVG